MQEKNVAWQIYIQTRQKSHTHLILKHMAIKQHNIPKRQFIGQNYMVQIQILPGI